MAHEKNNLDSGPRTPNERSAGFCKVFVIAVFVLGISAFIASQGKAMGWEVDVFRAVNGWPESLYYSMAVITFFGSTMWAPITVLIALLLRLYHLAWRLSFSIVTAYAFVAVLKHFVDRDRPLGLFQGVHAYIGETGMGFPSGHATLITVLTLTLAVYVPSRWRWALAIPILLVGLSRLYLGVHVPLDIIGGVALGTAIIVGLRILPGTLRRNLRLE